MVNDLHKGVFKFLLIFVIATATALSVHAKSEIVKSQKNNSLYFIENKGQIKDQYGEQRPEIDFKLKSNGLGIFIGSGHMHYQWTKNKNTAADDVMIESYRLDIELVGANTNIQPITLQASGYFENYYLSNLDGVQAYAYSKVVYKNIYNNIDWVLYVQDGGLKYDFIVHPGGNANDIKIKYNGATSVKKEDAGDVVATTPFGSVKEKAPYSYLSATKEVVPSSYLLEANTISFNIANTNQTLVIDPSLEWATYMGDQSADYGMCAASDTAGNVYMGGRTASSGSANVFTTGAHQVTFAGDEDGFITRYTASGVRLWSTYYGGNKKDAINSITVDKENNIVFAGWTDSSVSGIATTGAHKATYCGGSSDAFLVKMDPTGKRLWGTYYGGAGREKNGNDYQTGVACDAARNIYLVGTTESDTGIATTGTQQTARSKEFDGYIAKFDKDGKRLWGTYYGDTMPDQFTNVSVDSNGTPYVVGKFASGKMGTAGTHMQNKPTPKQFFYDYKDAMDFLLAKFNQYTGRVTWATYYGGNLNEDSRGIAVGDTGFVYICGSSMSDTGIATTGASQAKLAGGPYDMVLAKFDSSGKLVWGTYFGGSSNDQGGNVVIDHKGNLNVTGNTNSASGIATTDAFRLNLNLGQSGNTSLDALIAIYNNQGTKIWSSYYGGAGNDYGYGVARGKDYGHIYFTGNTESSSSISFNGSQNTHGGANDAFMVKITPDTSALIPNRELKEIYCSEDTFSFKFLVTERFRAGNVFTIQLSDANGDFKTPYNIGSKGAAGVDSGYILVKLPPNVSGTKFRFRIVGIAPIDTSYDNGYDVTIKPLPIWPVASNNGPTCSNDTLRLLSTASSSGAAYSWTGPDNYTASIQNPTRMNMNAALHSGDYIITVDLNGCTRKDTTTVVIRQAANKPKLVSNAPLCSREDLRLEASTTSTGGHTVEWKHLNGPWVSSTGTVMKDTIFNVQKSDGGKYVVILKQNGCESKDTIDVIVSDKPAPVFANAVRTNICAHETLELFAQCDTPGVTFTWTGPGGITRVEQNPKFNNTLTEANSGNWIVAASKNGCATRDTIKNIVIKKSPSKPKATSNAPLCSDQDLELYADGIATGSVGRWTHVNSSWMSTTPVNYQTLRRSAQVSDAGQYVLRTSLPGAADNGCYQYDTVMVNIKPSFYFAGYSPVIDKGRAVCPGDTIQLSVRPAITGVSFTWSGKGTFVPGVTSPNPKVEDIKYSDSGFYYVRMIGAECSTGYDSVHLAVVDTLSSPILILPPFDCLGDSMRIGATHPYMSVFKLQYPGGVEDVTSPGYTFNNVSATQNQGRYILGVKSGGCEAYDTAYLNDLRPTPAAPVASANTPVCEGTNLELKSSATAGVTYNWTGPNGFISNQQNPVVPSVQPAVHAGYYISTVTQNGCHSKPDTELVEINVMPRPEVNSGVVFCEGSPITLSVAAAQNHTYTWAKGSYSGTGSSVVIDPAKLSDAGMYTVTATSTITGCKGDATTSIGIIALPGKPDATYKEPLCEGDRLELSLTDTSTGQIGYVWRGPDNFVFTSKDAFIDDVNFAHSGSYVVIATRQGCTITDTVQVRVRPRPAKPVITNNTPLVAGEQLQLAVTNPVTGATFRWTGPQGFGSLAQNPVLDNVKVTSSGTYTVVTTLDGCSSSNFTVITIAPGSGKLDQLLLFPNPNNGVFTVKGKLSYDQIIPFEVLSSTGLVVYSAVTQSDDKQVEIKIELDGKLASGYYIFRVMVSGHSQEIPFSVVR